MWKITHDHITKGEAVGVTSSIFEEGNITESWQKFRIFDDDKILYYEGVMSPECNFEPLDDFGMPNAGCVSIHIWNSKKDIWEIL